MRACACTCTAAHEIQYYDSGAPLKYTHYEYVGISATRDKVPEGAGRARLEVHVNDLRLSREAERYLRLLAGSRVNSRGVLALSSRVYPLATDNYRVLFRQLDRLVSEAKRADAIEQDIRSGAQGAHELPRHLRGLIDL